jgi:hypothetical protein
VITAALLQLVVAASAPLGLPALDCPAGKGRTYEVGEGRKHASLGAVPWERLSPGDRVLVHARKEPYREKILLSARGTKEQPIRVCGVAGPDGAVPVIDGAGATTRRESVYPFPPTQERGVVVVTLRRGDRWGYKPGHLVIQGLEIRGAVGAVGGGENRRDGQAPRTDANTFVDNEGKTRAYNRNAACLFVERGEHITIRGNVLTDCGYGLFVASDATEEVLSREILVEGNWIHGNGYVGLDRRHNVYSEAVGITYQGNHLGPLRPGALGNQLKDRSAGTIVRYNWIEGGAHLLDLVEPEESAPMALKDPRFRDTWVYGNVLVSRPEDGSNVVHYGGDNGNPAIYRKGTLHFFHNTVVVRANEQNRWNTTLFRVETNDETVHAWNNVFWREGTTRLSLMKASGKLKLGPNWISSGYAPFQYEPKDGASVAGLDALIAGDAPGFVAPADGDYRPARASAVAREGAAPPPDLPAEHALVLQYARHRRAAPRPPGARAALGALPAPE